MSQQPPSGAGLGIRPHRDHEDVENENESDRQLMDMFEDDQPGDQPGELEGSVQPVDEEREPEGVPGQFVTPAAEPLATEGTTEEEVEAEAQRLAGIYETVPELERGYTSLQGAFTRVSQDYRQLESNQAEIENYITQQQQQMDELVALLQAREAEQDPEFAERLARSQEIQQAIAQRLAPIEEGYAEQQEQQQQQSVMAQAQRQAEVAVASFHVAHPDVAPGSPADRQLADTFRQLRAANVPLDIRNPAHLEIAYEATQNPALAQELMFAPNAVAIPNGMDVLRQRVGATVAASGGTPTPGTRPPAQGRKAAGTRPAAHVEVGSGGAPVDTAPGKQPDEFDEAMKWYQDEYARGPLFGSGR